MIKFSHSIFALPLALVAFVLALPDSPYEQTANHSELLWLLLKIIICMVSLRSAAMGFNRLVDAGIDAKNPRTTNREIPSGKISKKAAFLFIIFSLALFFAAALSINYLTGLLSPVAAFAVLGYSYTKRFTWLCHYFLGLSIGLAPAGAWIAVRGSLETLPLLWSGGLLFYIAGFDILYSCQDYDFDKGRRLHSIPARFGISPALWTARMSHLLAFALFIYAGWIVDAGLSYYAILLLVGLLFVTEHYLVRPNHLDRIPVAFFHINAGISTILFLAVATDLGLRGLLRWPFF